MHSPIVHSLLPSAYGRRDHHLMDLAQGSPAVLLADVDQLGLGLHDSGELLKQVLEVVLVHFCDVIGV